MFDITVTNMNTNNVGRNINKNLFFSFRLVSLSDLSTILLQGLAGP